MATAAAALKRKLYTLVLLAERANPAAAAVSAVAGAGVPPVAPAAAPAVPPRPIFSSPYSRVLLGMKKRGFGAGKWNGFGGKIELGETPRAAAVREMKEEACVDLDPAWLSKRAVILQQFEHDPVADPSGPGPVLEIHVYLAELPPAAEAAAAACSPRETEEMRPQWFDVAALPFDSMWVDDALWYPQLLGGEARRFRAHFLFRGHDTILEHSLQHLTEQEQRAMEEEDNIVRVA